MFYRLIYSASYISYFLFLVLNCFWSPCIHWVPNPGIELTNSRINALIHYAIVPELNLTFPTEALVYYIKATAGDEDNNLHVNNDNPHSRNSKRNELL